MYRLRTGLLSRKWLQGLVLAVGVSGAAACGGGGSEPTPKQTPNFQGRFSGVYTVTNCTNSGDLTGICTIFGAAPVTVDMTQNNTSVSGTFTLGQVVVNVVGSVDTNDGTLNLAGFGPFPDGTITLTIVSTRFTVAGANLFGTFQAGFTVVPPGVGTGSFTATLTNVVKQP